MHNIFILYMPIGNHEAMVHYEDTIKNKVDQKRIFKYIDDSSKNRLINIFGLKPITTWGSRNSPANQSRFQKMQPGDDILIVEGETIKLLGKIATKTINPDLSQELWKNIRGGNSEGWDLIYFIANPIEINLPFLEFKKLFNYNENWQLRGFTNVSEEKVNKFNDQYDDLYSVLLRLKNGEQIQTKEKTIESTELVEEKVTDELPEEKEISDHIKMQYVLAKLGRKTGSKVWVPKSDQGKIKKNYNFDQFEETFSAGIDTPAKYVEQIDVVWKEEFRIDAAFEIENSTSIYSGLLRFADLKLIAPNSDYPLFLVAPRSKKNRVISQVRRPTFKHMDFDKKVRYLSYEAISEIDEFFMNSSSGFDARILSDKSESLESL